MRSLNERYLYELFDHIKIKFKPLDTFKDLKDNSFLLVEILPTDPFENYSTDKIMVLNDFLLDTYSLPPGFKTQFYDVLTVYYGLTPGQNIILPKNTKLDNIKSIITASFPKYHKVNIYHIDDENLYLQVLNYTQLIALESNFGV